MGKKHSIAKTNRVLDSDRQPWERQSWETDKQWEPFRIYRNTDPMQRSISALYHLFGGKSSAYVYTIATANKWRERIAAYDNHIQQTEDKERAQQRQKLADRRIALLEKWMDKLETAIETANPATIQIATDADILFRLSQIALGETTNTNQPTINNNQIRIVYENDNQIGFDTIDEEWKPVIQAPTTIPLPNYDDEAHNDNNDD